MKPEDDTKFRVLMAELLGDVEWSSVGGRDTRRRAVFLIGSNAQGAWVSSSGGLLEYWARKVPMTEVIVTIWSDYFKLKDKP